MLAFDVEPEVKEWRRACAARAGTGHASSRRICWASCRARPSRSSAIIANDNGFWGLGRL